MEKYFEVLRKCSLFQSVSDDDLLPLLSCLGASVERFEKKETIIQEGTPASALGIMLSGSAQVVQIDYFGNRSIVSGVEPSETFAESFACAFVPSIPISVIANEACEVMLIDCRRIMYSCSNSCGFHQQIIFNLMTSLANKNIQFHRKIEITSKRSTREKLLAYLLYEAKKQKSSAFDIPFDRQELADYLEVDRSGLSSEIGKMIKGGIIKSNKKHFELLEMPS